MLRKRGSDALLKCYHKINTKIVFLLQNRAVSVHFWSPPALNLSFANTHKGRLRHSYRHPLPHIHSPLCIMPIVLTLGQYAPNVNHQDTDMLSRLRTMKIVPDFQLHPQSCTVQSWSLQKTLQPMVTHNSLTKKKEENLVSPASVVLFQVLMNYTELINKLIKAAIRSPP